MKPMPTVESANVPAKTETSTQPMPCQKAQTSAAIDPPIMMTKEM
ncbi:hypothetical protein ACVWZL_003000 [Bradyrhizobium sp. GM2.4]